MLIDWLFRYEVKIGIIPTRFWLGIIYPVPHPAPPLPRRTLQWFLRNLGGNNHPYMLLDTMLTFRINIICEVYKERSRESYPDHHAIWPTPNIRWTFAGSLQSDVMEICDDVPNTTKEFIEWLPENIPEPQPIEMAMQFGFAFEEQSLQFFQSCSASSPFVDALSISSHRKRKHDTTHNQRMPEPLPKEVLYRKRPMPWFFMIICNRLYHGGNVQDL